MQGIRRGVNNGLQCGPLPSVAHATGGMHRFHSTAQGAACGSGMGRTRATKKCRCQFFRANQEGLETVYGTVG